MLREVPIPSSVRETGTIPDGYSVGESFHRPLIHTALFSKLLFQTSFSICQPSFIHSKKQDIITVECANLHPCQTLPIDLFMSENSQSKRCMRSKMLLKLPTTLESSRRRSTYRWSSNRPSCSSPWLLIRKCFLETGGMGGAIGGAVIVIYFMIFPSLNVHLAPSLGKNLERTSIELHPPT